ncbi:ABC transporter substrate-binding protein [Bdellovibrio sp. NC01]|uniref:substrate-binding periplasmic protein n=1 Tax=Bdellovibrio sp. NC01 TaxID=2220073 RepID=UPI001AEF457D|nr:transporter substrate-binding domain-containing protein [Bdellovibrio sp. NC01]
MLIVFIFAASSSAFALKKELKAIVYNFPPHIYAENADGSSAVPTGASVDFFNQYLNSKKKFEVKWVAAPFARVIADLEHNKADIAFVIVKDAEREKIMRFSSVGLAKSHPAVVVMKNSPLKEIKSMSDLKGWTLGYTALVHVPSVFKEMGVKFDALTGTDSRERNLERLRLKKIDGVYVPTSYGAEELLRSLDPKDEFRVVPVAREVELYVAFSKTLDEETYQHLNKLIEQHHDDYQALLRKYSTP